MPENAEGKKKRGRAKLFCSCKKLAGVKSKGKEADMKKGKLEYLEGFKGWACVCVMLCHFIDAFLLSLYNCSPEHAHTSSELELILGKTPLNIFYSGNFGVRVFFVISGFVLSYKFFSTGDDKCLKEGAVKRYFRLILPIFLANTAAYVLMALGAYHNQTAALIARSEIWLMNFNNFVPSFLGMLRETFIGNFFEYQATYVGPLWTMTYEFLGSLLVFAVLSLIGKEKVRYLFYAVFILIFRYSNFTHFIIGMMMCDIMCNQTAWVEKLRAKKVLVWILFIIGFYFGSYPSGTGSESSIYAIWNFPFIADKVVFWHLVGATLMIFALLNCAPLQKLFESRPFRFLGKHSFSLYLVHWPVIATFSCWFLVSQSGMGLEYMQIIAIDFVISAVIIFVLSVLMTKYVDKTGIKLSNFIVNKLFHKEEKANGQPS